MLVKVVHCLSRESRATVLTMAQRLLDAESPHQGEPLPARIATPLGIARRKR